MLSMLGKSLLPISYTQISKKGQDHIVSDSLFDKHFNAYHILLVVRGSHAHIWNSLTTIK